MNSNKNKLKQDAVPTILEALTNETNKTNDIEFDDFDTNMTNSTNSTNLTSQSLAPALMSTVAESISCDSCAYVAPASPAVIQNSQFSPALRCDKCMSLNDQMKEKDAEIVELKKRLRKAQKSIWYLETVKKKLNNAIVDCKKKMMIDEELLITLEVYITYKYLKIKKNSYFIYSQHSQSTYLIKLGTQR